MSESWSFVDDVFVDLVEQDDYLAALPRECSVALVPTANPQIVDVYLEALDGLRVFPGLSDDVLAVG